MSNYSVLISDTSLDRQMEEDQESSKSINLQSPRPYEQPPTTRVFDFLEPSPIYNESVEKRGEDLAEK
jgi:hypothetical protein